MVNAQNPLVMIAALGAKALVPLVTRLCAQQPSSLLSIETREARPPTL